jgi:hypothetical protein
LAEVGSPVGERKAEEDSPVVGPVHRVDLLAEAAQADEVRLRAGALLLRTAR